MQDYRLPIAFGVAIILALGFGLVGWRAYAPTTPTDQTAVKPTPEPTTFEYTKTPEGDRKHIEHEAFYDIEVTYPDTAGIAATAGGVSDAAAVRTMETFVANQIAEFKSNQNFENLTPADIKILGFDQGVKYSLGITYEKKESPKTTSFVFTIHVDTGGAHPNTFYQTFTWMRTGKQVVLADLFAPGKPYLTQVANAAKALVIQDLEDRGASADAIFQDGFAPTDDNFANFYLEGKYLVIMFPPYQVAPYAAGTQTAKIPLTSLKDIKSEFK